jgi:malate dehydrogenase (oxaloacetate-decarboxylating)
MLMAGVHALASLSPALTNPEASLLPDLADVRAVSVDVAAAVVRQAVADGNAQDEATIKIVQGKEGQSLEDYIRVSENRWGTDGVRTVARCTCMGRCRR